MELLAEGLTGTLVNHNAVTVSESKQNGYGRARTASRVLPWYTLQSTSSIPWRGANYGIRVDPECSEKLFPKFAFPRTDPPTQRSNIENEEMYHGESERVTAPEPRQDPCFQIREKMKMPPFRTKLVGGKLYTLPEKSLVNPPKIAWAEERELPRGVQTESVPNQSVFTRDGPSQFNSNETNIFHNILKSGVPKNEDQNEPNIYCCPDHPGFRENDDGRPNTPPLGRSAQLSDFIDSMIDRSDNRGFFKENLTYPPYFLQCRPIERSKTEQAPVPKRVNNIFAGSGKQCPELNVKPSVELPKKTKQQMWNEEIDKHIMKTRYQHHLFF